MITINIDSKYEYPVNDFIWDKINNILLPKSSTAEYCIYPCIYTGKELYEIYIRGIKQTVCYVRTTKAQVNKIGTTYFNMFPIDWYTNNIMYRSVDDGSLNDDLAKQFNGINNHGVRLLPMLRLYR